MKSLFVLLAAVVTISVVPGCKSKSSSTTPPASFMKADINGAAFSVSGISQASASSSSSGGINFLYVSGRTTTGQEIRITLIDITGTGTIPFATGDASAYYYPSGSSSSFSMAASGSVTVTALTPDVVGTFNFITTDGVTIANGSFSVTAP